MEASRNPFSLPQTRNPQPGFPFGDGLAPSPKDCESWAERSSVLHPLMIASGAPATIAQSYVTSLAGGQEKPSSASDTERHLQCYHQREFSSLPRQNTDNICPERRITIQAACNFASAQTVKDSPGDFPTRATFPFWERSALPR